MRTRDLLRKIDRTLDRMDEHMAQLVEEMREDNRRGREEIRRGHEEIRHIREEARSQHERDVREHLLARAAVENNTRLTRELLLQGQEHRKALQRIEQGIHAQTQGLLHVLDELRDDSGPGTAPAA